MTAHIPYRHDDAPERPLAPLNATASARLLPTSDEAYAAIKLREEARKAHRTSMIEAILARYPNSPTLTSAYLTAQSDDYLEAFVSRLDPAEAREAKGAQMQAEDQRRREAKQAAQQASNSDSTTAAAVALAAIKAQSRFARPETDMLPDIAKSLDDVMNAIKDQSKHPNGLTKPAGFEAVPAPRIPGVPGSTPSPYGRSDQAPSTTAAALAIAAMKAQSRF